MLTKLGGDGTSLMTVPTKLGGEGTGARRGSMKAHGTRTKPDRVATKLVSVGMNFIPSLSSLVSARLSFVGEGMNMDPLVDEARPSVDET